MISYPSHRPASALRARMIEDMSVRGFSEKTRHDYIRNVRAFAAFTGRSPDTATAEDLRRFQLHQTQSGMQPPSINSAVSALRFLLTVTLDRPDLAGRLTVVRRPRRLPAVLSVEEVALLLQAAPGPKYKAALATAYGAGLRVSEVVALKVGDIDSERMLLRVEKGKGRKDRNAMLSPQLLELLRDWWRDGRRAAPRMWYSGPSRRIDQTGQTCRPGPAMSGKDKFTPTERSAIMARVRSWNTTPERMVRSTLHKLGYRYRLHDNRLPGKPDLSFPSRRIALFVNGCFWHRHPNCKRASTPIARQDYWVSKFQRTTARDNRNRSELEQNGWTVLVVWECQLRNLDWLAEVKSALDSAKPLHSPRKLRMQIDCSF